MVSSPEPRLPMVGAREVFAYNTQDAMGICSTPPRTMLEGSTDVLTSALSLDPRVNADQQIRRALCGWKLTDVVPVIAV